MKSLADIAWFSAGDSKSLTEIEGLSVIIHRFHVINTRFGEAMILDCESGNERFNVITSSSRIMSLVKAVDEFPVSATFYKKDNKWFVK